MGLAQVKHGVVIALNNVIEALTYRSTAVTYEPDKAPKSLYGGLVH